MSWFKKALAISVVEPGSYYVVVDPVEFYEWRHSGVIPKDTKCSALLPPSEIFTDGYIIVSINANEEDIVGGKLKADIQSTALLKVGHMPSREELIQRYHNLDDDFRRNLHSFKQTCLSQGYLVVPEDEDSVKLYRILPHNDTQVRLQSFGSISDITERLSKLRDVLDVSARTKTGRAFEMEDWRRVENMYTFMTNKNLPLDATKIAFLLEKAEIEPKSNKIIDWINCYAELTPEAKKTRDKVQKFRSFNWVKEIAPPFVR